MKRAAIYARFSSDRQNERSAEDQIDLCSAWAERQGFVVVGTFQDAAISGASTINRMGFERLRRAAKQNAFDVIVSEALDRISRDQADLATFRKEMNFLDIAIHTVQDGEVGAMHVGLKGLMGEMYLADLAQKTRRGLRARIKAGASAGGRSYGYDLVDGKAGVLVVNEAEALIVRRIFREYLSGKTPRQIVAGLNSESVPSPRGGAWNASTVNGSRKRGNGVLSNRLYIGEIVWNRQRFVKDPATGKRVSRLNPESEWMIAEAPELAIVSRDDFERAGSLKAAKGSVHCSHARRPPTLLSGLVKCGCCGASYTAVGRDRLQCAGNKERGNCPNTRSIRRQEVEDRVINGLRLHLAEPELIAAFVHRYQEQRRASAAARRKDSVRLGKRIGELTRTIDRIVDAVCEGRATDEMFARCRELEEERNRLREELGRVDAGTEAITLHPGAAERYRRMVADLHEALGSELHQQAVAAIRGLLEAVIVTPTEARKPFAIEVRGRLAELLQMSTEPPAGFRGMLVAGARNSQSPQSPAWTFAA